MEVSGQTVYFNSSEDMSYVPDKSVDFFITSPPYWHLKDYGTEEQIGPSTYEEYLRRLNAVWAQCYEKARDSAVLVINVNNRRHKKRYYPIAFDIVNSMEGWQLWDTVIWYVPNALPQPNHYRERLLDNKFEFLLVFTKDGASDYKFHKPRVPQKYLHADPRAHKKNENGRCLGNILRIPAYRPPNVKDLNYHVAAYPEELVAFFLQTYTDVGDTVCDPFLGSGTTLKVSRVMNRRGIGFELNREFAPLITERINELWEVPDWKDLDLIHSTSADPGMTKPRKIHFLKAAALAEDQDSFL
ncbi:MAG: site-specific DNA-methyltransferase [Gemmatimonadales bacterium]